MALACAFCFSLLMRKQRASGLSCLSGRMCQKAHGLWISAVSVIVMYASWEVCYARRALGN